MGREMMMVKNSFARGGAGPGQGDSGGGSVAPALAAPSPINASPLSSNLAAPMLGTGRMVPGVAPASTDLPLAPPPLTAGEAVAPQLGLMEPDVAAPLPTPLDGSAQATIQAQRSGSGLARMPSLV